MIVDAKRIDGARLWWTRLMNRRVQYALDFTVLCVAFVAAYLLRFDFHVPHQWAMNGLLQLPFVVFIEFVALHLCGVYRYIWRYIGMVETSTFLNAAFGSTLLLVLLRGTLPDAFDDFRIPYSIILMNSVLAFGGGLGLRVFRRALYERYEKQHRANASTNRRKPKPVVMIGAGRAGVMAMRELAGRGDSELDVKGFLDDDPLKQGALIHKTKVLGRIEDLPRIAREHKLDHVIISIAQASRADFRRIIGICESVPVKVQVIPGLYEIINGRVGVSRVRDVQIEDLLGREPIQLDQESVSRFITDKVVMVTGAGGSIGSELVRQVARFRPARLLLVERSEPALFQIDHELRRVCPELTIEPLIADVCDRNRMRSIFAQHRPHLVFHAAAHKHVPMMEANPSEAIKNNVLATEALGELAGEHEAEAFVLISTDKAVRPTSVMGASKRVAELVVQKLNRQFETRFLGVRFGNVIGSAGSVIPIFRDQITKGGPVTVTHPEMVRYFMTIPEAAQLVLQAGAMGEGGEIFILDMGEPVKILQLAVDTITLSGFKPYDDIDIIFTGLRPGEKLFEELEMTGETVAKTRHPKIFIGKIATVADEQMRSLLERLAKFALAERESELRSLLNRELPEARLKTLDAEENKISQEDKVSQEDKISLAATTTGATLNNSNANGRRASAKLAAAAKPTATLDSARPSSREVARPQSGA